jgi:hypothetical protein
MGISGVGGSQPYYGISGDGPLGPKQQQELQDLRDAMNNLGEEGDAEYCVYRGEDYASFHTQLEIVANDLQMPAKYKSAALNALNTLETNAQWGVENKVQVSRSYMQSLQNQFG